MAGTFALEEVLVAGHGHVEGVNHLEALPPGVLCQACVVDQQLPLLSL